MGNVITFRFRSIVIYLYFFSFFFIIDDYVKNVCHCVMIPTRIFFFSLHDVTHRVTLMQSLLTCKELIFLFLRRKKSKSKKNFCFQSKKKEKLARESLNQ